MLSSLKKHLVISLVLRLVLIIYGEVQDKISEVPYTDVDYRVVTDGSRHILNGNSPFNRHTYRYTPLLAIMLLPNIILHSCFGKILFALFDLAIAVIIKRIIIDEYYSLVINQSTSIEDNKAKFEKKFNGNGSKNKLKLFSSKKDVKLIGMGDRMKFEKMANNAAYVWLYNPLTMIIATRGNGDAITSALVLMSLYYLLKVQDNVNEKDNERNVIKSGIFHGLAIHFRLYPIFFSLAYYMYLSSNKYQINSLNALVNCFLKPNRKQVFLILTVLKVLIFLTGVFYLLYDYKFLYESTIFHFVRKDTRHNFSIYFYLQYLNSGGKENVLEKLLTFMPQLVLIILTSFHFSRTRQTIQFGVFIIAFIMVTYNPVITSQYFVWFLSLLPLTVNNFRSLSLKQIVMLVTLWFAGQGMWLFCAYFLEFKGINSFDFIWLASTFFFIINVVILQMMIENYDDSSVKLK
jgi:phosphatidylinositol glycan class M